MDESRRAVPRRVLKSGTIEFDRGAYSCAVRNLSEAGAALDVPCAVAIPHEFRLIMDTDQLNRHCRVIWRKQNRLGVAFVKPELVFRAGHDMRRACRVSPEHFSVTGGRR
jgi:hypothetical protein